MNSPAYPKKEEYMISILEIKQLRLKMAIGVTDEERSKMQDVEFNITINFESTPLGCKSDKITDTLCYDNLTQEIKTFCLNNKFHLIEHLSFELYNHIKAHHLYSKDKLALQVCKFAPVEEIKGQCCFTIKD